MNTNQYTVRYMSGTLNGFRRGASFLVRHIPAEGGECVFISNKTEGLIHTTNVAVAATLPGKANAGNMFSGTYAFQKSAHPIIRIDVSSTRSNTGLRSLRVILLRLDEKAALRRFEFQLSRDEPSTLCYFEAPCDLVPIKNLRHYVDMSKISIMECKKMLIGASASTPFVQEIMVAPEKENRTISTVKTVVTPEGGETTVVATRRKRFSV